MYLWKFFFHTVDQCAGDVVDLVDRQIASHGAVAGNQDAVLHLAHSRIMTIQQFIVF